MLWRLLNPDGSVAHDVVVSDEATAREQQSAAATSRVWELAEEVLDKDELDALCRYAYGRGTRIRGMLARAVRKLRLALRDDPELHQIGGEECLP